MRQICPAGCARRFANSGSGATARHRPMRASRNGSRRRRGRALIANDRLSARPAVGRARRPPVPEIGRLDRGDEVEIIGDLAGILQVRTPSGSRAGCRGSRSSAEARRGSARLGAPVAASARRSARAHPPSPASNALPGSSRSIDDRRVVGRDRRALARLAVDLGARRSAPRPASVTQEVVDPHAHVLVEMPAR